MIYNRDFDRQQSVRAVVCENTLRESSTRFLLIGCSNDNIKNPIVVYTYIRRQVGSNRLSVFSLTDLFIPFINCMVQA